MMGGESIAGNGAGGRELCWCVGGVLRVAKNREKSNENFVHLFFDRSTIIAISRKRYGTSPCALHAVITVYPFGTRPVDMHIDARRRRDSDCMGKTCDFGGAFAGSKMTTLFSRFPPGIFLFHPDPNDFERVLGI